MGMTNKEQKRWHKWIFGAYDSMKEFRWEFIIQYVSIGIMAFSWDWIAEARLIRHSDGLGCEQWILIAICLIQIIRHGRKLHK